MTTWADPDGMIFYTRDEYERMEEEYKNSETFKEIEVVSLSNVVENE